ncbi:MAG: hypothetical protein KDC98_06110 [Planctomycetes bacterium]|nr:hypothetical protein [Planctomycetota bacterium]
MKPEPTTKRPGRRLTRRKKLLFALVPLIVLMVVGEILARGYRARQGYSPFMSGSYRDLRIDLIRRGYPAAHDPLLGYVPRPGFASDDNQWHAMVTIDEHCIRQNGGPRPTGDRVVLAVGDSFTFGDGVGDGDTWPARLEHRLGRPVINAGVFGYGMSQIVLRAEQLLATLPVERVVLSFIPDDLNRCELSRRFTPVPWYSLDAAGELVLQGVPVPDTAHDNAMDSQWLRRALGYSALIDMAFWNTVPNWWVSERREVREHPRGTGTVIGKKLMERLARACDARGVKWMVVLQGYWLKPGAVEVLQHAAGLGAETLDLSVRFAELHAKDDSLRRRFFPGHMSAVGNDWVAGEIAAALERKH